MTRFSIMGQVLSAFFAILNATYHLNEPHVHIDNNYIFGRCFLGASGFTSRIFFSQFLSFCEGSRLENDRGDEQNKCCWWRIETGNSPDRMCKKIISHFSFLISYFQFLTCQQCELHKNITPIFLLFYPLHRLVP